MIDQLGSGIELMLIGMGIVFLFLGLLVAAVSGMSWIVSRWFPQFPAGALPPSRPPVTSQENEEVIAVISAAVHRYRTEHQT